MVTALSASLLGIGILGGTIVFRQWRQATASLANAQQRDVDRLYGLVDSLLFAAPESASVILESLRREPAAMKPLIRKRSEQNREGVNRVASHGVDSGQRLRFRFLDDRLKDAEEMSTALIEAEPAEFAFLQREVLQLKSKTQPNVWERFLACLNRAADDDPREYRARFQAALVLCQTEQQWSRWAPLLADYLMAANPLHLQVYHQLMQPLPQEMIAALNEISVDDKRSADHRRLALRLLAEAHAKHLDELLELVKVANDDQLVLLLPKIIPFRADALPKIRTMAMEVIDHAQSHSKRDRQVLRISNAVLSLYYLGDRDYVWPHLRSVPRPDLRTSLIHRLPRLAHDARRCWNV